MCHGGIHHSPIGHIKLNNLISREIQNLHKDLLVQEHAKHSDNPWLFPSSWTGAMYHPDSVATLHQRILKDTGPKHIGSMISDTLPPPWPSRAVWTSGPCPPCWDTMTPGSPCGLTFTPPVKNRMKLSRPWGISRCRCSEGCSGKNDTAHRTGSWTSLPVRCVFSNAGHDVDLAEDTSPKAHCASCLPKRPAKIVCATFLHQ